MACYSHLFKNCPKLSTVKGFCVVNKVEVDVEIDFFFFFFWNSCFCDDSADIGNLISGSSAFSKYSLNIWKFTVHVLLKPGMENNEHSLLAYEMSAIVL